MAGGKSWKMLTGEDKKSHLPFAGIILVRFYGYYLSLIVPPSGGMLQHPGNLRNRFSAGHTKIGNGKVYSASYKN
jgi:hypothetical protein